MKKILALALTLALALPLAACGGDSGSASTSQEGGVTEVTVGVVGASNGQWDTVNELLADEGIQQRRRGSQRLPAQGVFLQRGGDAGL